ncbi:hypothetical protein NQ314_001161 [Rhamnusium bicolor]|uniref:PiggyBac transposable element-derived protein domain-containing protein n=1 Tax=Rhamnusium bicolor TaxID=1586634 RepID=A0AAV8ZW03_9CUCU|nr:hypothetical protein NQ314_001161 [Rhamnusium bicolor]
MDIHFESGFSLAEALEIVYNDDIEGNIFVEPPDPNVDTDEDSGDEDAGGLVDNLTSRQLRAGVEIRLANNKRIGVNHDDTQPQIEDVGSIISEEAKSWIAQRIAEKSRDEPQWISGDFEESVSTFPKPNYSKYQEMSITDIFEQFVNQRFIEHLVDESRRYALFLNCPVFNITADEIRCFIAILFVSGYNDLPSKRHYWDSNDDMKNYAVSQSMRRDRFLQICRFGKNPKSNNEYEKLFRKAASPLLLMLDELPNEKKKRYSLYIDNLFSGPALYSFLKFRGCSAIGTIRENRIPKECPLTTKTVLRVWIF